MPAQTDRRATSWCDHCHREFEHNSNLPKQHVCMECYYESRGDLTGALWEKVWRAGFEQGLLRAGRDSHAEHYAKLRELLPFRDVLALCHPDVHPEERRERATRTTAVLLDLRSALEATPA